MTIGKLNEIIKKHNIPDNVVLQSDSGWECCETPMDGVWYSKELNTIVFTPNSEYDEEYIGKGWMNSGIPKGAVFTKLN